MKNNAPMAESVYSKKKKKKVLTETTNLHGKMVVYRGRGVFEVFFPRKFSICFLFDVKKVNKRIKEMRLPLFMESLLFF